METVDPEFRKSVLLEMVPEISLSNLKDKMVNIFYYKIGGDSQKEDIYYTNKKCYHYKDNSLVVRQNLCEKGEYCEFGHLIKFDKDVIAAGFNFFMFLFNFKEACPQLEGLDDFDIEFKNEKLYQKMMKSYEKEVAAQAASMTEKYKQAVEQNEIEVEDAIQVKTEEILQ